MASSPPTTERRVALAVSPFAYPLDEFYAQAGRKLPAIEPIAGEIQHNHIEFLLFAAVALFGGVILVEAGGRMDVGNMTWGTVSAYLSLLPWLMTLTSHIRNKPARWIAWALFALHVISGARHLYRFLVYRFL